MVSNPYAKFLGSRDPVAVLESTYGELSRLSGKLPKEQFELRPPAGKWNAREIVAHLADCELVFGFRLRQALAEDRPTVQPFDQEKWARRYGNADFDSSLRLFSALREWSLTLIRGTSAAERQREMTHPEYGVMTFQDVVEMMAGHDINHLQALERMAERASTD